MFLLLHARGLESKGLLAPRPHAPPPPPPPPLTTEMKSFTKELGWDGGEVAERSGAQILISLQPIYRHHATDNERLARNEPIGQLSKSNNKKTRILSLTKLKRLHARLVAADRTIHRVKALTEIRTLRIRHRARDIR